MRFLAQAIIDTSQMSLGEIYGHLQSAECPANEDDSKVLEEVYLRKLYPVPDIAVKASPVVYFSWRSSSNEVNDAASCDRSSHDRCIPYLIAEKNRRIKFSSTAPSPMYRRGTSSLSFSLVYPWIKPRTRLLSRKRPPSHHCLSTYKHIDIFIPPMTTMASSNPPRQPLKLLMLHGYTQSGATFHAKSRALIKHITKAFPLHEVAAIYPTGPISLDPADIPGYEPPQDSDHNPDNDPIEAYGWWRRSNTANPPLYVGIEDGLHAVAKVLRDEGPFDGIIGFSQGAALAAMIASLLEVGRMQAFSRFQDADTASAGIDLSGATEKGPIPGMPYPESFAERQLQEHPPLKFALCYSGFRAPGPRYRAFYEDPAIQTPVLHVLGSLDAVVDDSRSQALIQACTGDPEKEGKVIWHPGGHFLPSQRPFLDAAVRFIQERLGNRDAKDEKNKDEEDVNNMDLPF